VLGAGGDVAALNCLHPSVRLAGDDIEVDRPFQHVHFGDWTLGGGGEGIQFGNAVVTGLRSWPVGRRWSWSVGVDWAR